jgi:phosphate acetyltransferase
VLALEVHAPTGAGVGLTSVCLGLLRALDRRGIDVGYVKPLAQPHPDGAPDQSAELVRSLTSLRPPEPLGAIRVEELLGVGDLDSVLEEAVGRWQSQDQTHDVVVVEGLNPGPTQIYSSRVNQALAKALDADVVLVGTWVHSADQSDEQIADHLAEGLSISARPYTSGEYVRVVGCAVTRVPSAAQSALVAAALERRGLTLVAAVQFEVSLTHPRVADLGGGMFVYKIGP